MRSYTIKTLIRVRNFPGLEDPPLGPVGSKADNIRRLLDHRWRCVLKWIEADIASGTVEIANETARILRMVPEHCARVQAILEVDLEEYVAADLLEISPAPALPLAVSPDEAMPRHRFWHLNAVGLRTHGKRRAKAGRGQGVTVAVIGTGIDGRHPELDGRVVQALTFDARGRSAQAIPSGANDLHGNGTYVASLIAGNTIGVAPAARLVSLQALDARGSGTDLPILSALDWLAGASIDGAPLARIAVLCFGSPTTKNEPSNIYQTVMLSLMDHGILPIVPVGSGGPGQTALPGNCYGVMSVGATTRQRRVAKFSGDGELAFAGVSYTVPSLVAPGELVYGARSGSSAFLPLSGSVPATAVVAGIAALILERQPDLNVWDLQDQILSQCRVLPRMAGIRQGAGLVQAEGGTMR